MLTVIMGNDWLNIYDECLLQYLVLFVLLLVTFVLFVGWWTSGGKAGEVYAWLTLMIGSRFITIGFNALARAVWLKGNADEYRSFVESTWWSYRSVPEAIVLCYMLALIASRMSIGPDIQ